MFPIKFATFGGPQLGAESVVDRGEADVATRCGLAVATAHPLVDA